jgi:hypothetical protein
MKTADPAPDTATAGPGARPSAARAAAFLAGPALITVAVVAVLSDFVRGGAVSISHPDVLPYWLPTHCFLGRSLAAGHIPAWSPHSMGGAPFAADPQSGWMYLPAMALYAAVPCDVALRWFVVLGPVLAGLGIYAFLRAERVSRPAATLGGLALSLPVAGSTLALSLPFSGSLAWSAVTLAGSARWLHARAAWARLLWAVATAVAWGQVAAAHGTNGLVIGTGALIAYLAAGTVREVRAGRRSGWEVVLDVALLAVAMAMVNLAFFLPRVTYLPRTSLGAGYGVASVVGGDASAAFGPGVHLAWPLRLALAPGLYLGAAALALVPVAILVAARHRYLAWAFAGYGGVSYLLSLEVVARLARPLLEEAPVVSFYLHRPDRFAFGLLLALPVLAALGLDSWRTAVSPLGKRGLLLAPGAVVWLALPFLAGAGARHFVLAAAGTVAGGAALSVVSVRPSLAALVPAVLAVELFAGGLLGKVAAGPAGSGERLRPLFQPTSAPVDLGAYLRPGPIARALQRAPGRRYLSVDPERWDPRGYHVLQTPEDWGLLGTHRAAVFGLEEAQGYNPVQPVRYWTLGRTVDPRPMRFNVTDFRSPPPTVLDLLQVGWLVGPADDPPVAGASLVAREGRWGLYRLPEPAPRASIFFDWTVVDGEEEALEMVTDPAFDPTRRLILEPGWGLALATGLREGVVPFPSSAATYRALGPQAAQVEVVVPAPAVVLVRNTWDPGWRAMVDGRPAPILVADYFLQGIPVAAGRHTIVLGYDDPSLGLGLLGSGLALAVLLGAAAALWYRDRRSVTPGPQPQDAPDREREPDDRPGPAGGEGLTGHRQHEDPRQGVHGYGQRRGRGQDQGEIPDPEPPGDQ